MGKNTVLFDTPREKVVYGILGDTYVYVNERQIQVEEPVMTADGPSDKTVTVVKYMYEERHFPLSDKTMYGVIEALKKQINDEITAYDNGEYSQFGDDAVNDFTVNGMHMWLDKETRNGLKFRFDSQLYNQDKETTLWYGIIPINLSIEHAIGLVQNLEVYASKCFDKTAEHRMIVNNLTTIEDLVNYDYTTGYPEKLSFIL